MAVQRDPRLLYGAEIRQRILDDVADDISRLGKRRKVGRLVSSELAMSKKSPSIFVDRRVPPRRWGCRSTSSTGLPT